MDAVLSVEALSTHFVSRNTTVRAVDGVSFSLAPGERLALVGESGSGKSVTAMSIMRLLRFPGKIVGGRVKFRGDDLVAKSDAEMRRIRGAGISMIFQDPANYLDPMFTAGHAIGEAIRLHEDVGRTEARRRAIRLLQELKVPSPEDVIDAYPFQLSGGMCQRVLIAAAISSNPDVLIADEATSGLDVTVQASVLRTLRVLAEESGTAILMTTHSMQVVRKACSRTVVMYCGRLMEVGPTQELLQQPLHPYTAGLLRCMPDLYSRHQPLVSIGGEPPAPGMAPSGCAFVTRCPIARPVCSERQPPLSEYAPGRWSACPFVGEANA
jgi:oligopeptide/dipeptide ABC transporter ATP-binding protein